MINGVYLILLCICDLICFSFLSIIIVDVGVDVVDVVVVLNNDSSLK